MNFRTLTAVSGKYFHLSLGKKIIIYILSGIPNKPYTVFGVLIFSPILELKKTLIVTTLSKKISAHILL